MKRKERLVCVLADGRRVRNSLQKRGGVYHACFRGLDGRKYLSTKEVTCKRAEDAAVVLIREHYQPPEQPVRFTHWEEAMAAVERALTAKNRRPRTIQHYQEAVARLRQVLPGSQGPADIAEKLAQHFAVRRAEQVAPTTLYNDINALTVIWSRWLIDECRIVGTNPWEEVAKPKLDEPQQRHLEPTEEQAFFAWLSARWDGWRLPVLFFTVKSMTGRRITQLCTLPSTCLRDGRVVFLAGTNKGRRMEYAIVPEVVYRELETVAGPTWLWERYSDELNALYRRRGQRRYARCGEFLPQRLKRFLQGEVTAYNKENEEKTGWRSRTRC